MIPSRQLMLHKQSGVMMLEAILAILIFSIGVLGLMGLQVASINNVAQSKYRTDASYLANQIIAKMWLDQPNLSSYTGTSYSERTAWDTSVQNTLPSGVGTIAVNANVVTVTVTWRAPNESATHNYKAIANINAS